MNSISTENKTVVDGIPQWQSIGPVEYPSLCRVEVCGCPLFFPVIFLTFSSRNGWDFPCLTSSWHCFSLFLLFWFDLFIFFFFFKFVLTPHKFHRVRRIAKENGELSFEAFDKVCRYLAELSTCEQQWIGVDALRKEIMKEYPSLSRSRSEYVWASVVNFAAIDNRFVYRLYFVEISSHLFHSELKNFLAWNMESR